MNNYKRFLFKYLMAIVLIVVIFSPIFYFVYKAYEHTHFNEIVKVQLKEKALYGTALNQNTFGYKLSLIKEVKPEIVFLGSSTSMAFRKNYFHVPIVNAGGSMNYLGEGHQFIRKMLKFHQPKIVIIGVDSWWFNPGDMQPKSYPYHSNEGNSFSYHKLIKPIRWLYSGKIPLELFLKVLKENRNIKRYSNQNTLGISAILNSAGYRDDGSYQYDKQLRHELIDPDEKFLDTIGRVQQGNRRFDFEREIPRDRWKLLLNILKDLNLAGVKTILFTPPLASPVLNEIEKLNKHEMIFKLQSELASLGEIEYYNYFDPSFLETSDCEFTNGFHMGDILAMRVVMDMAKRGLYLKSKVKLDLIENFLLSNSGKTIGVFNQENFRSDFIEPDNLKIGCRR